MANKYIEDTKPWNLIKEDKKDALSIFICILVEVIRSVAQELEVFMPQTAGLIQVQFEGQIIKKGEPLFPRIEATE